MLVAAATRRYGTQVSRAFGIRRLPAPEPLMPARRGRRRLRHPVAAFGLDEGLVADRGSRADCVIYEHDQLGREPRVWHLLVVEVDVQRNVVGRAPPPRSHP